MVSGEGIEKAAKSCKAKTGVVCDGFHPKVPLGFDERNKRESGGILGEGRTVWEMATESVHNDVFLESEERYDRASHCAHAGDGSLVGSLASAKDCERTTQISF